MSIIKKFFISLIFLFTVNLCFSLPGVIQTIPDQSGQYVYYRDYSFERESYFGIVFFDDSTFGVRYFAPAITEKTPLVPSKDIYILFSLDSSKKYIELTGEKILSAVTPEDTDIINYLHDMLYELTSRRQKAGIFETTLSAGQEFEQFGGAVILNFDSIIPIFNLKSIVNSSGQEVLKLITAGQLLKNDDLSFAQFYGLPLKLADSSHQFTQLKKVKKEKISYKKFNNINQKITIDNQWTKQAENLFMLSNLAVLALDVIDLSSIPVQNRDFYLQNLTRKFTLGTDFSYPYAELFKSEKNKSTQKFSNTFYNDNSKSFTKDFKILTKLADDKYGLMTLTVFTGAYTKNSKYFDSIIKSYSVN